MHIPSYKKYIDLFTLSIDHTCQKYESTFLMENLDYQPRGITDYVIIILSWTGSTEHRHFRLITK